MSNLALDKVFMRNVLIRDKKFLLNLFKNEGNVLGNANNFQMNTVIRVVHLIMNNEIELLEKNYKALKNSKRLKSLVQHFDSEKNFLKTLKLTSESKRQLLKKFSACYPYLLHGQGLDIFDRRAVVGFRYSGHIRIQRQFIYNIRQFAFWGITIFHSASIHIKI
jgi:hypothetical protein